MPTYDYRCAACGHELEHFQSIREAPLKKCPKCGKPKLERLIGSGAGVLFKGSGFYQTDYRSESYKKSASSEDGKPASAPETTGSKSEGSKDAAPPKEPAPAKKPAKKKDAGA